MDKVEGLKKEIEFLVRQGELLLCAMADGLGKLDKATKKRLKDNNIPLPNYHDEYDIWYSESLRVIQQLLPDRLDDFVKQYKDDRRKETTYATYTISDYLIGLRRTRGGYDTIIVDTDAAIPRMQNQVSILKSVLRRTSSSLFDIREVLQANIFDSELDAAQELCKRGFFRASGAMAGVVLEAHLSHVCTQHNLKTRKKKPTIGDLNDLLKDNVIDTAKWRFVQHLGDLRNLCDHKRERDPEQNDVNDLIEGVKKVIKTVF